MHGSNRSDTGTPSTVTGGEGRSWQHDVGLWIGVILALAATLPVLVAWAPQMTDYPSHLAGYKIQLEYGHNAFLTAYYTFKWE